MHSTTTALRRDLPSAVVDLAVRLGAISGNSESAVVLTQKGTMKRTLGKDVWIPFTARQTIDNRVCGFAWRARFGPLGLIGVCDALENGKARLDVTALGVIPIVRTTSTAALVRGELMRYLAELPWAPDAIFRNDGLRWQEGASGTIIVGAGQGAAAVELSFDLDGDGRIATTFAPDRPRSAVDPILPTPWRGRFSDYRLHDGRWLPFAGEVAWEIDGEQEVYWKGTIESWSTNQGTSFKQGSP